jgi:cytochrome c-type biogenesis protein
MNVANPLFWPLAFFAGALSFTSPCVLPLLPGYLSFISGVSGDQLEMEEKRNRILLSCFLFVAGFAFVFTALGASASVLGSVFLSHKLALVRVSGVVIILMGLFTLGLFRIPTLYMERRFHIRPQFGPLGAVLLGMAFAFGWTPCVGPVLSSIYLLAGTQGSVRTGAALLFVYSLGLGLPFVLAGFFVGRGLSAARWLQRHYRALNIAGGTILVLMGLLLLTDQWVQVLGPVMRLYAHLNWPPA